MKCFQSQFQCMKDQLITVGHIQGIPSDIYPNSEISGYHDFYELEFFTAGEGIHYINGVPYHVQPGYVYLLIPGDFHRNSLPDCGPSGFFGRRRSESSLRGSGMPWRAQREGAGKVSSGCPISQKSHKSH